jgi:outer membrane receptor protein involved in Fe transport
VKVSAFKLLERLTTPATILEPVYELGFPDLVAANAVDTVRKNGRPQWRMAATLGWRKGTWRVSSTTRCVSNYTDTSVSNQGIFLNVPGGCSTNLYLRKGFNSGWLEDGAIRFGVRNVLEKEPAKNDSTFGVSQLYASLEGRYWWMAVEKRFR